MRKLIELLTIIVLLSVVTGCGRRSYIRDKNDIFDARSLMPAGFNPEFGAFMLPNVNVIPNIDGGFDIHIINPDRFPGGYAHGFRYNKEANERDKQFLRELIKDQR